MLAEITYTDGQRDRLVHDIPNFVPHPKPSSIRSIELFPPDPTDLLNIPIRFRINNQFDVEVIYDPVYFRYTSFKITELNGSRTSISPVTRFRYTAPQEPASEEPSYTRNNDMLYIKIGYVHVFTIKLLHTGELEVSNPQFYKILTLKPSVTPKSHVGHNNYQRLSFYITPHPLDALNSTDYVRFHWNFMHIDTIKIDMVNDVYSLD